MLSRRAALLAAVAASSVFVTPAFSTETKPFTQDDFAAAQKAGKPIFVAIHATWCPTCKAQKPILSELMAEPKFKNLIYFVVDFDSQKDAVNFFGAQMQSTLIAFKGEHETGRSVGDTDRSSIAEDTLIYERWRGRSGVCCGRADKSVALRPAHPPSGRRGVR